MRYRFFFATIMRDGKDLGYPGKTVVWGGRYRGLCLALAVLVGVAVRGDFVVAPVSSLGSAGPGGSEFVSAADRRERRCVLWDDLFGWRSGSRDGVQAEQRRSRVEVLRRFTGLNGDGARVYGGVIEARNGLLYGLTGEGGISNQGTIFRLGRDGSGYQVLRSFTGAAGDGAQGFGGLTEGSDGLLYGTTRFGGNSKKGTVFGFAPRGRVTRCFIISPGPTLGVRSRWRG